MGAEGNVSWRRWNDAAPNNIPDSQPTAEPPEATSVEITAKSGFRAAPNGRESFPVAATTNLQHLVRVTSLGSPNSKSVTRLYQNTNNPPYVVGDYRLLSF